MPRDRDLATAFDICECVRLIEEFVSGLDFDDFADDERTQSAVILQVLLIGEAAKTLSAGFRERFPQIPWSEIMRMRDKLIHHYEGRDLRAVWEVAQHEAADLRRALAPVVEGPSSD